MATPKLGRRAKIYVNSATYGSPTWVEISLARDVSDNKGTTSVDADCREMGDWEVKLAVSKNLSIDFDMIHDSANAAWVLLSAAFDALSTVDVLMLDGPRTTAGSKGMRATCSIEKFAATQPLKNIQVDSVTLAPALSSYPPETYTA